MCLFAARLWGIFPRIRFSFIPTWIYLGYIKSFDVYINSIKLFPLNLTHCSDLSPPSDRRSHVIVTVRNMVTCVNGKANVSFWLKSTCVNRVSFNPLPRLRKPGFWFPLRNQVTAGKPTTTRLPKRT